jgi:hypothetical protein
MNSEMLNKVGVLAVWAIAFIVWAVLGWWFIPAFLVLLHTVEVFLKGIPIGKKAGIKTWEAVLMTLIFGYAWWIPVGKGIAQK